MARLEEVMGRSQETGRQEQQEALLSSLSSSLVTRLDQVSILGLLRPAPPPQVVTGELKRSMPGLVSRALDGVKAGVEREVGGKLRGLEQQLESSVAEILRQTVTSTATSEQIGRSVATVVTSSLGGVIQETYRAAFQQQAQGFERALQVMLRQMAEQFGAGAREYEAAVGRKLEVVEAGRREELAPVLQGVMAQVQEVREGVARLGQVVQGLARGQEASQGATAVEVQEIVRREVMAALVQQQAAAGRQETPAPDLVAVNLRQTIQAHIQAGRTEAAFQAALSANDLAVVVFTCELLNTTQVICTSCHYSYPPNSHPITQVFNSATCPLSQSVLLSLIQQLSVDLGDKTEVASRSSTFEAASVKTLLPSCS